MLPGIVAPFIACIEQHYSLSNLTTSETQEQIITGFTITGTPQEFYINKRDGTLTWQCDDSLMVRRIGAAFNRELAAGKFQHLFGKFDKD